VSLHYLPLMASILLSATIPAAGPADAQGIGINLDLLGVSSAADTLKETAERTMIQLQAIEQQTNYDAEQRIEQVRSILKEAIGGTQKAVDDAIDKMKLLETQVNNDAVNLIYRAHAPSNKRSWISHNARLRS